jgi:hypothetical protein
MSFFFHLIYAFLFCQVIISCGPSSLDDFREEGEGISRKLTKELALIHTRHELLASQIHLTALFNELVDVIIAAQEFRYTHPDSEPLAYHDIVLSEQLRNELNRIYGLEEGRKIIERCQEDALDRLNTYERKIGKRSAKP